MDGVILILEESTLIGIEIFKMFHHRVKMTNQNNFVYISNDPFLLWDKVTQPIVLTELSELSVSMYATKHGRVLIA